MTDPVKPADTRPSPRKRYSLPKRRGKFRRWFSMTSKKTGALFTGLLFDGDGLPRAAVRHVVFDAFERPRPAFQRMVFKGPGRPRRSFAAWYAASRRMLPTLVAGLPFPAFPAAAPRCVVVVSSGDPAGAGHLCCVLARSAPVLLIVLDGEAPAGWPVEAVPVPLASSGAPRGPLLEALAHRLAAYRPLFAVALGVADAADELEQAGVPTVLLVDGSPVSTAATALDRASAVVFPSDDMRRDVLARASRLAGRPRLSTVVAPLAEGAEQVIAIGRDIGVEMERDLALCLGHEPQRLEPLALHEGFESPNDRTGATDPADQIEQLIARWRYNALMHGHPNRPPLRRPYSGFHPLVYAEHHREACFERRRYPLAHWIEQGCPPGPWAQAIISPPATPLPASSLKTALHGHFYYVDLLPELLHRLGRNATRPDLYISTDTREKVAEIGSMTADYPAPVRIDIVPNRGRDIGPFLTGLRAELTGGGYDVVFHVHGKKTKGHRRGIGDPWRTFLWENLIGGEHAMLDAVLAHMQADPQVGLVHPEDLHLLDWANNRRVVEELRRDMGLTEPLGDYVDFPVGTMFAARPAALAPMLGLALQWDEYPPEPIAEDGTFLHGLERLLPMTARHAGFTVAGVRVPGTDWD